MKKIPVFEKKFFFRSERTSSLGSQPMLASQQQQVVGSLDGHDFWNSTEPPATSGNPKNVCSTVTISNFRKTSDIPSSRYEMESVERNENLVHT